MERKKVKITFEYSNPNTSTLGTVLTALLGIVLMIGLIVLLVAIT